METQRVVAAIIVDQEEYLVCRRAPHKSLPGKWEFPGGKPEAGESDEAALKREIQEELGIGIEVIRQFDASITGNIELICFVCQLNGERPTSSTDHDQLQWLREEALSRLDWAEADKPALKRILIPFC